MATIIERSITPEHAEQIQIENNNQAICQWSTEELLSHIDFCEREIKLNATGNTELHEIAWRYVLFPSNQERDAKGYPVNYDPDLIRARKDRFITACREMLARANCSGDICIMGTKDINGNETTVQRRIKRLIKFRQNMFKQFKLWEDSYSLTNLPNMVSTIDTWIEDDDKNSPYQKLLLYLLNEAYENKYRRYKEQCCLQIGGSRAWRPVKDIATFVYDCTQKEDNPEMWKHLTSKGNTVSDVVKHLTNCKDHQFPEIKKNRHVWSFRNGLLVGKNWSEEAQTYVIKFYDYKSTDFKNLDATIVSSKYFDQDFDAYDDIEDWYAIPTPHMQKVLDYQKFSEDVCKWLYVFCGRLCFDVNDLDGWQIIPFLKGIARDRKSVV